MANTNNKKNNTIKKEDVVDEVVNNNDSIAIATTNEVVAKDYNNTCCTINFIESSDKIKKAVNLFFTPFINDCKLFNKKFQLLLNSDNLDHYKFKMSIERDGDCCYVFKTSKSGIPYLVKRIEKSFLNFFNNFLNSIEADASSKYKIEFFKKNGDKKAQDFNLNDFINNIKNSI